MQNTDSDSHNKTGQILLGTIFGLAGINIFSKIFGFAEKIIIAHFFGTGEIADIYFASMAFIISIVYLVKELIQPSLLPIFSRSLCKGSDICGLLFQKMFLYTAALLGMIALFMTIYPEIVTNLIVPGFSDEKKILTGNLIRLLSPAMVFWGLSMVTMTALNARKFFIKAAWPITLMKLFISVGLVIIVPIAGVNALIIVINLGVISLLCAHLYFLPESRYLLQISLTRKNKEVKQVLILMGPIAIGVISSHISGIIDNMLGSTLPDGRLAYLGYSKKLIDAILLIGPVALVTVVYSQLCHLAQSNDKKLFADIFGKSLRLIICFACPVSILMVIIRADLISILFERGSFTTQSTIATAETFMFYALGLTTFSLESLVVCSFFALKDTKTPVIVGIIAVGLDIAMAWGFLTAMQHLSIAIALVVSKSIKVGILLWIMRKKLTHWQDSNFFKFSLKISSATALAGITTWKITTSLTSVHPILKIITTSIVFMSTFITACQLLKINEFKEALFLMLKKNKHNNYKQKKNECNN